MKNNLINNLAINSYRRTAIDMCKLFYPDLSYNELIEAIDSSIDENIKNTDVKINNNYRDVTSVSTLLDMTQYILSRKPITTSHGVLFMNHESTIVNPIKELFQFYLEDRKRLKKKMFKYPKGSEEYERYNLAQLLRKINANSIYGLLGLNSSYFYNVYLAAAITRQGKSSIAAAITLFESFLGGNVGLGSLDEIVEYIHHIITEPRVYDDRTILDDDIDLDECWFQVMNLCGFNGYIPSIDDMNIVYSILSSLNQVDLNRIYYKNNLYAFCDNKSIQNAIVYILERLKKPFLDPNDCPKEIEVEINEFKNLLYEYVYYRHIYQDKVEKVSISFKRVSVLTDTDSSMISLDAWYRYVLPLVIDKNLKINKQYVDETKFVNTGEVDIVDTEVIRDYNFYTDEFMEVKRSMKPDKIIPQDNLRYSIINIMLYIVSQLSTDYMRLYSSSYNSFDDNRCLMVLKNEMLMKRIMLQTTARKHYAYLLEMQEGHMVPSESSLGITGMELNKSNLQMSVRYKLKSILFEDILKPESIDLRKILVDIVDFEKEIYDSLRSGSTKYYKPVSLRSIQSYDNPMLIQGIKAAMVYNETKEDNVTGIDLNSRNSILIIKVKINPLNIEPLKGTKMYEGIMRLFQKEEFKTGITAFGVPNDVEVPRWVLDYIDYYQIINDNIKVFPLDSVGLVGRAGNDSVNHSNILRII